MKGEALGQKHYTIETWKEKATQVHNGKYTYDKITEYINGKQKGEIYCTNCEEYFEQSLSEHINGSGHRKCSAKNSYWVNIQPLLDRFKKVHGDKYDYSKFVYKGFHEKSTIICKEHGEFLQSPSKHTNNRGCSKCGRFSTINKQKKSEQDFIDELNIKFPNKFKFDRLIYKNNKTTVTLYCNDCEEYHEYIPNPILSSKYGCSYCYWNNKITTFSDFYDKLDDKSKSEYTYHKETFVSSISHMKITHKVCEKSFMQSPYKHLVDGRRCPYCAESGFKKDRDSILYYLKVNHNGEYFYKIGITNNSVEYRYFNRDLEKIEKQITFPMLGQKAWDWEKALIKEYEEFLYKGDEIVLDSAKGNAELFTKDILGVLNGW